MRVGLGTRVRGGGTTGGLAIGPVLLPIRVHQQLRHGDLVTISVVEVARRSGSTASIPVKMLDRFADGSVPVNLYRLALPTGATLTDGDR
jgi:hypothetical protein